ncbi:mitochondrial sodium/calcium exchanger protein-like isoform X2 [Episyrphus balteatus]|uniref:mitochondrial sodium/calcium exchanger protein-like isoform X2 n=1 Tax=Episyrphus balteatus TaxID=286459 RepID=UPI0024864C2C|nr:mitochondrial sodium/calcium exchanger protein-like isoform X2 [Episyrphus balteatus]
MTLYENFNTSNQTSPHFEKHENFVIDLKSPGCTVVQTLNFEDRCRFVETTLECHEEAQLVDYTHFFYCTINAKHWTEEAFGVFLLFLVCLYMFAFVGTTTDKFFCPPLKMITKKFGISQNFAGVTLLAFGNSVPDIVSGLVGVTGDVGTMYSDLMGSAMFITAFIAGVIVYLKPMQVEATTFTRDIGFHILAVAYIDYAIKSDRFVSITESIVILSIYGCYFTTVIMDQVILVRTLKSLERKLKQQDNITAQRLKKLQEEAGIEIVFKPRPGIKIYIGETAETTNRTNEKMLLQFLNSLNPVDMDDWRQSGLISRTFVVLKIPINLFLCILVPAVDFNLEQDGWSKLLNCLQIVIMPAAICAITVSEYTIFGFSWPIFTMFLTTPICIVVFCVTRTDKRPSFHIFFAIFSMVGSIFLVRIFTKEIINVLDVLGIITFNSQSFLGCTFMAWGDQIGDLIASIAISQQGYQKMGFAACIAGPLFYLTIALGGTCLYKTLQNEDHVFLVPQGSMGENCTIFLMLNLIGLLFAATSTNFYVRKSIGINLIITYGIFLLYCLLGEYQLIHPFGTDHSEDYGLTYL